LNTSSAQDAGWNAGASFMPMSGPDELPAIRVAGALVFAYVRDGELVVSAHLDDIDPALVDEFGEVGIRLLLQDEEIWTRTAREPT
jgi:hypothetical protein